MACGQKQRESRKSERLSEVQYDGAFSDFLKTKLLPAKAGVVVVVVGGTQSQCTAE